MLRLRECRDAAGPCRRAGVIKGIHHCAFRCRDSEATRAFYEDFLGCPLVAALPITRTMTGRPVRLLHTYYRLGGGAYVAFFEDPDRPFEFKDQHDCDLHISFDVDEPTLLRLRDRARENGMECRGVSDHGFIRSIYLRDPNGYVVELVVRTDRHDIMMNPSRNGARSVLAEWQKLKVAPCANPAGVSACANPAAATQTARSEPGTPLRSPFRPH